MKHLLFIFLAVILGITGCSDSSDFISPPDNPLPQLIKLPPKSSFSVENTFSISKSIKGDEGGTLKIDEEYETADGQTIKIKAKLKVPKDAFDGTVIITMMIDDEFAAVQFYPAMVFAKPLKLDLKFEGLDLEGMGIEEDDLEFVYVSDDGTVETIETEKMEVKIPEGKLSVKKARLNHFSRYGWSR